MFKKPASFWLFIVSSFASALMSAHVNAVAPVSTRLHSESMDLDGLTGKHKYQGNALLTQDNMRIAGDEMSINQDKEGKITTAHFTGKPVRLEHTDPLTGAISIATANDIHVDNVTGVISLRGDAHLSQKEAAIKRELNLHANSIQLTQINRQLQDLKALGSPSTFSQTRGEELPVNGQANALSYDGNKQYLILDGAAKLQRGQSTLEHSVIEYDGINQRTLAPKREGQQIQFELIQEPKENGVKSE